MLRELGRGRSACDVTIAWTFLAGESRRAFRAALPLDAATWCARSRLGAMEGALITFAGNLDTDPAAATTARYVVDEVLSDP